MKYDINIRLKEVYATIGANIVRLRGKISQEDLAKKAKIARGTISAIENAEGISLKNLIKIADALDVEVGDLFISKNKMERISYMTILLLEKLSETLKLELPKKE